MYEAILVPTDGSEAAKDAAKHAFSLSERYNAPVHVLAVIEQNESTTIVGHGEEKLEMLREEGTDSTKRIIEEAESRGIEAIGAVEMGDADRAILQYANEYDIDIIVMSTNARSGVGRFLRGSVTEKVIRDGDIPVLAIQR